MINNLSVNMERNIKVTYLPYLRHSRIINDGR